MNARCQIRRLNHRKAVLHDQQPRQHLIDKAVLHGESDLVAARFDPHLLLSVKRPLETQRNLRGIINAHLKRMRLAVAKKRPRTVGKQFFEVQSGRHAIDRLDARMAGHIDDARILFVFHRDADHAVELIEDRLLPFAWIPFLGFAPDEVDGIFLQIENRAEGRDPPRLRVRNGVARKVMLPDNIPLENT